MAYAYRFPNAERCVNCCYNMILGTRNRQSISRFDFRVEDLPEQERELLTSWVLPQEDLEKRPVCRECHYRVRSACDAPRPVERQVGHSVCAACGDSLRRQTRTTRRADMLKNDSRPEYELLQPYLQLFQDQKLVCYACVVFAKREIEAAHMKQVKANTSSVYLAAPEGLETEETSLPGSLTLEYGKVVGKKGACASCNGATALRRVNLLMRQLLLLRHKLYVTNCARVCEKHHNVANWTSTGLNTSNSFTEEEISDMIFLLKRYRSTDFGNVENLDPMHIEQWLGVSLENYQNLLKLNPVLAQHPDGKFGLAVWLARKHTQECTTVLASLTQRTKAQVTDCLKLAHDCMSKKSTPTTTTE